MCKKGVDMDEQYQNKFEEEDAVLCVSNAYAKKFYLAPEFESLPDGIKKELQIMCVLFTEEIGGILEIYYDEEGSLLMDVRAQENDFLFDEIGSALKVKQLRHDKEELFEGLEMYYRVFLLGEDPKECE